MNSKSFTILAISNLALAAAVTYHVVKPNPSTAPTLAIGIQPLSVQINTLNDSVKNLSLTLQRFNTTAVQSDYLEKEIDRLSNIDQNLNKRINFEKSKDPKTQPAGAEKEIQQLEQIQSQIQKELKGRRDSLMQIISGLEHQLGAATSNAQKSNAPENATESKAGKSDKSPVSTAPPTAETPK